MGVTLGVRARPCDVMGTSWGLRGLPRNQPAAARERPAALRRLLRANDPKPVMKTPAGWARETFRPMGARRFAGLANG